MLACHTKLPADARGAASERMLADALLRLPCDGDVWFNVGYLPGVREIDALMIIPAVGAFVIEVKGVEIGDIEECGPGEMVIKGRSHESPQLQALRALHHLRDYVAVHGRRILPFLIPTVCWPRITRSEWAREWAHNPALGAVSQGFLFQDDLADSAGLMARLALAYREPPTGMGAHRAPAGWAVHPEVLLNILSPRGQPRPSRSEIQRVEHIERTLKSALNRDYPPGAPHQVLFSGAPGTGKTFRLLALGWERARIGQRVLYVCFNKTLAADIRRLIWRMEKPYGLADCLHVHDVFELLRLHGAQLDDPVAVSDEEPNSYWAWAAKVVAEIGKQPERGRVRYDAVLVDEAQDLKDPAFDLVQLLTRRSASLFVAHGRGQELYGGGSTRLEELKVRLPTRGLRRVFRNAKPSFLVAQRYWEGRAPDEHHVVTRASIRRDSEQGVLFSADEGEGPRVLRVPDAHLWLVQRANEGGAEKRSSLIPTLFRQVIEEQLALLAGDDTPSELLLLVPLANGSVLDWVRAALAGPRPIAYLDCVDARLRRACPAPDQVRLCTFHSARGIESARVLVFGFEQMEELEKRTGATPGNLGYVVLSRARVATTVVLTSMCKGSASLVCLEQAVASLLPES
jgi:hypothetical protein